MERHKDRQRWRHRDRFRERKRKVDSKNKDEKSIKSYGKSKNEIWMI